MFGCSAPTIVRFKHQSILVFSFPNRYVILAAGASGNSAEILDFTDPDASWEESMNNCGFS